METRKIKILVQDSEGNEKKASCGQGHTELVWYGSFEPGDKVLVEAEKESYVELQLDALIKPALIYTAQGLFIFEIPFGIAKEAYPQEAFVCQTHQITAEYVEKPLTRHNLSENPLDVREETGVYPHCTASVETRGESVFAARNTIDGLIITSGHGFWPHTSWGDGEDPNAEIIIWFGRKVQAEEVQVFLRSDFPHDNYWQEATLGFSDGYEEVIHMEKTGACQSFILKEPRITEWVKMKKFRKDENDPSPFPALTQWKVYGREI